jgi:plasminogen activator
VPAQARNNVTLYGSIFLAASSVLLAAPGYAADASTRAAPVIVAGSEHPFSAEIFSGYLTGQAGEFVYRIPGDGAKLSQLKWQVDNAAIIGGRLIYQPYSWLSLRAGGWAAVADDSAMDDFDWLYGYEGMDSWSHWSHSADTRLKHAYQIDLSAAFKVYESGPVQLSALAGYRFLTLKMDSYGGNYIYSDVANGGFRDLSGTFPDRLGISYQQWWHTPYLGLGVSYDAQPFEITAEVIASPFVASHDKDFHALRSTLFKERFSPDWMIGAKLGVEYTLTETISLTGQAEYQKYFEAKGGARQYLPDGSLVRSPKPIAGGDFESLTLTVGVKAKL